MTLLLTEIFTGMPVIPSGRVKRHRPVPALLSTVAFGND